MLVYTVTKPVGTKDKEFGAYIRLLEDVAIDVSNSTRVPEPGTDRRWLYAWRRKIEAERFADELRRRTGDADWTVYQFENATEERGPVAPLDIARIPENDRYTYYLTPASSEHLVAAFPGTRLPNSLDFGAGVGHDFLLDRETKSGWKSLDASRAEPMKKSNRSEASGSSSATARSPSRESPPPCSGNDPQRTWGCITRSARGTYIA